MARRLSWSEIQEMQNNQVEFFCRIAAEMGGVAPLKIFWTDFFLITEPAVIRELLLHHAHQLHRDPVVTNVFKRFLGNGVFVAEGKDWQRQRKLMQPAFHALRIRDYTDTIASYTRDMLADWHPDRPCPLNQELTRLTLRIIAKTLYDVDLIEETTALGRLMYEILSVGEAQLKMPILPPAWLPTAQNRRQQRALTGIRRRLAAIVDARLQSGVDHGDLLSMLLTARDEAGDPMSREQILDECITLFMAGHETSAAALTWAWHLLGQHPHLVEQLTAEVNTVIGEDPITVAKLAQMPLLEAVVKETLRLYPPAYGFGRTVIEQFQIQGIEFPRKSILLFSIYATHRRADLWEDPLAFRPQRFLDAENQPDRYTYLPFGAGSRICLGNMFAMLEIQVVLATMLQHVRLTPLDSAPVVPETLITLRPRDTLYMQPERIPRAAIA